MAHLPTDILEALVRTIELKDMCTAAHTWRVVLYARALGEAFSLTQEQLDRVCEGAALHDLGKIDLPDHILTKEGKLTDDEFAIVKTHPALGYDRLVAMGVDDAAILAIVRHHHERADGKGYPDGLTADRIHLAARYFAVIDSFDALTSVRSYRPEHGKEALDQALEILYKDAGTHYCLESVQAFDRLLRSGHVDWIMEHFNDTCPVPQYSTSAAKNPRPASPPPSPPPGPGGSESVRRS